VSVDIDVRGADELRRELEKVMGPELKKTLQRATNASGKFLKPFVQAAAPRRTGRLRRSISSRQARRNRPATVITARPRIAYYRHMVIDGTRAHRIRFPDQKAVGVAKSQGNIRHPGATANPFIGRAASQHEQAAFDVARRIIDEELP
jgi:hypothetical protein